MADIDYRLGIENATVHAELAPSEEVAQLWQHIRENYEYLLMFDQQTQAATRVKTADRAPQSATSSV